MYRDRSSGLYRPSSNWTSNTSLRYLPFSTSNRDLYSYQNSNSYPEYRLTFTPRYTSSSSSSYLTRYRARENVIQRQSGLGTRSRLLFTTYLTPSSTNFPSYLSSSPRRQTNHQISNDLENHSQTDGTERADSSRSERLPAIEPSTSLTIIRLKELLTQSENLERMLGEGPSRRPRKDNLSKADIASSSAWDKSVVRNMDENNDYNNNLSEKSISSTDNKTKLDSSEGSVRADEFMEKDKLRRQIYIPNELLWEIVQFVPLSDVGKLGTVNSVFVALIEPRVQLKIQLLREQIDRTKKQLDETNEQIATRQEQIAQLNGHIVTMNERLGDMNGRLASVHSEIERSHRRIDELLIRLRSAGESLNSE